MYSSDQERIYLSSLLAVTGNCWEWQRKIGRDGYGAVTVNRRHLKAHRLSYEAFVGPIPEGLTIDHLCRNRKCVNPKHLEAVPMLENIERSWKTHCPQGHALTGTNLIVRGNKRWRPTISCRECTRTAHRKNQQAKESA